MNRQQLINTISIAKWRVHYKIRRYREVIAYARNRMDKTHGEQHNLQLPGRRGLVSARNTVGRELPADRARLLLGRSSRACEPRAIRVRPRREQMVKHGGRSVSRGRLGARPGRRIRRGARHHIGPPRRQSRSLSAPDCRPMRSENHARTS